MKKGRRGHRAFAKHKKSGFKGRPNWAVTGALVASAALGGGFARSARAQDAGRPTPSDHPEHTELHPTLPPLHFDIPAGPLETALQAFETTSGLKLHFGPAVTHGIQTNGVTGEFTPEDALKQLLAGIPIRYRFVDSTSIVLDRIHRGRLHDDTTATQLAGVAITSVRHAPGAVTSPKYTVPPKDIPQTITVVSQDVMEQQGTLSLRDAMRNVAGITINSGEGGSTPGDKFNVRGFSAASDIYVDGVRDVSGYSRETFNLEQVEVTKGPNGSIDGRGSTGGTINLVTKTPSLKDNREAIITLGDADQRRATVDMNQSLEPLGVPHTAVRLNVLTNQGGIAGDKVINNTGWGVAPSIETGLGTSTQALLSYTRTEQNNIPAYGVENFNAVPTVNTRNYFGLRSLDFEHVNTNQLELRLDHDFGTFAHLRNQTTRGHGASDRIVTSASPLPTVTDPDSAKRGPKTHINDNDIVDNQTNLSMTFATGSVEHDVVTGVEFAHENSMWGKHVITGTIPSIVDLNAPSADADFHPAVSAIVSRTVRANSVGAYAFETMKINPKLELDGGLRWDRYDPTYTDSASIASGLKASTSSAVTGHASIVVKPTESGSVYAALGTSFDPSSENLSADAISANSDLPPEKSRSYEVGSKWSLFKERLLATVALFRTDKTNARTPDPDDPSVMILAGKQRVQGAEAGVSGNVTSRWTALANYSYLESKYLASGTASQVGTGFTNVPKHSINTWTTYEIVRGLTIGGGAQYLDKRLLRLTDSSQVYVPSYHLYNAMGSYQVTPTVGVQLNLYNLSNKLYYDSGRMWVPAAARSVSVSTSIKF